MTITIKTAVVLGIAMLTTCGTAAAAPMERRDWNERKLPSAAYLVDGASVQAPIAFFKFCNDYEDQCAPALESERAHMTEDLWLTLASVNAGINRRIAPDSTKHGFEWSLDTTYGNCNDYAVQKRKALLEAGIPVSALSLTVVVTPSNEGHLILTVRTDRGDFVLDNLRPGILAAQKTGYRFLKRHVGDQPMNWVALKGSVSGLQIASVRHTDRKEHNRQPAQQAKSIATSLPLRPAFSGDALAYRPEPSTLHEPMIIAAESQTQTPELEFVVTKQETALIEFTSSLRMSFFGEYAGEAQAD